MTIKKSRLVVLCFLLMIFIAHTVSAQHVFIVPKQWKINDTSENNIKVLFGNPSSGTYANLTDVPLIGIIQPDGSKIIFNSSNIYQKNFITSNGNISGFNFTFTPDKNHTGDYILFANSKPYHLTNNDVETVYQDYIKTILHFNTSTKWDKRTEQPIEIIPYTRPYDLQTNSIFVGKVVYNNHSLNDTIITALKYNKINSNPYHPLENSIVVKTDCNGFFSITFDQSGTWFISVQKYINDSIIKRAFFVVHVYPNIIDEMLIDTDDQLSVNDQILDENTKFIYEQLRQSTFYLTISSVIIIFLIFLLLISFYRFRKKEINQYFLEKYNFFKKKYLGVIKRIQKIPLYEFIQRFILKGITFLFNNIVIKRISTIISKFFNWGKVHPLKALCISYFIIVFIKIVLSQIYIDPTIGVDRYHYLKMAKSFWFNQVFIVNGEFTHKYPPLYPIAISPSFIFDDIIMITRMIRVINAFLSSLILFPIFYMGKEFINKINSLKISIVISLIASSMLTVFFVMSENLYYPLFILTVLTLYLTVKNNFSIKFMILSGIFIGLCFLTRYTTIAMIPAVLIFFFFFEYIIKKKKVISCGIHALKNWLFINVVAGIVIFPWLVRNGVHFGFTINGIIGYTNEIVAVTTKLQHFTGYTPSAGKISLLGIEGPPLIFNFLIEIILHNAYLILGSGILFFILAFHILKRRYHVGNHLYMFSLFVFILSLFYILLTSFHVIQIDWKLMGRYVEPLIPLFILLGFISYKKIKYSKKFITSSLFILYLITIFLIIPPLNRYSKSCVFSVYYLLSIDRIPKYLSILDINSYLSLPFFNTKIIMFLVLTIIFLIMAYLIITKKRKKIIIVFSIVLLLIASILPITECIVEDRIKQDSNVYQIGLWLNDETINSDFNIVFDKDLLTNINGIKIQYSLGSWTQCPIYMQDVTQHTFDNNTKYIITFKNLTYPIVYEEEISEYLWVTRSAEFAYDKFLYIYQNPNYVMYD